MIQAWMRRLEVKLTSTTYKNSIVFGNQIEQGKQDLDITVEGTKYMSSAKDSFTIKIRNLTYAETIKLITGKYYDIEIKAGYKSSGIQTIFKGAVIYMSHQKSSPKTNTVIILAGNELVAKYGQSRMNLSLNSGINMYSALKFICERAGVQNSNIDVSLKNRIFRNVLTTQSSCSNILESLASSNNFLLSGDSSIAGSSLSLISAYKTNNRVVELDNDKVVLINGYPKLSSDGLTMSLLPTFNFMPLDVIKIDNSIIDISVSSNNSSDFIKSNFFDKEGKYIILQIDYSLTNRQDDFNIDITAKSRSLYGEITNVLGYK